MKRRVQHADDGDDSGEDGPEAGDPTNERQHIKSGTRIRTFIDAAMGSVPRRIEAALKKCRGTNPNAVLDKNEFKEMTVNNMQVVAFVINHVDMGGSVLEAHICDSLDGPDHIFFAYKSGHCIVTWEKNDFWRWWHPRNPGGLAAMAEGEGGGDGGGGFAYIPSEPSAVAAFVRRCVHSTPGKMAVYLTLAIIPLTWFTFAKCRQGDWDAADKFYTTIWDFITKP